MNDRRATEAYGRHLDACWRCNPYHGPPYPACPTGERLRQRMVACWPAQEREV